MEYIIMRISYEIIEVTKITIMKLILITRIYAYVIIIKFNIDWDYQ